MKSVKILYNVIFICHEFPIVRYGLTARFSDFFRLKISDVIE